MPADSNERMGPWTPLDRLSTSRRCVVWRARRGTEHAVLKVARTPADRESVLREANLLGRVEHPNIVRMVDHDPHGDWLAMEEIRGHTLDSWAVGKDVRSIVRVIRKLIDALEHLHARRILHADLKPRNVVVRSDGAEPVLIDLGIAVLVDEDRGGYRGTPGYVAPEVLRGGRTDVKVDLYGLGGLWYSALCGRPPFVATDPKALGYLPLVSVPVPPSAFRGDIPSGVEQLVLSLLQREPSRRPASLAVVQQALPKAFVTPLKPPVVGMLAERQALRQAVIGAYDGECRVVVLYGPPGSGRDTLITETLQIARRAGIVIAKPPASIAPLQRTKDPVGLRLDAAKEAHVALLTEVLDARQPGLFLVHADFPVPMTRSELVQLTPPQFTLEDIEVLIRAAETPNLSAQTLLERTHGFAGAVVACITGDAEKLPVLSARILAALPVNKDVSVESLAKAVNLSALELLDHCEVLFAAGLVVSSRDGYALRRTSS